MTQSFPSGSASGSTLGSSSSTYNDRREHDDNQSTNEIRADIDQTRASVGEKIDQLQARLDPNRLKQQAQETVQEMFSDTANSMTEYVRSHKDEMVNSLADAARRNPLPTALVGLGIGWLILESMSGNRRHDEYEVERRNFRSRNRGRFEGSTGRSFVSQGRGQFMEEDYYSPEYYDAPDYGRSGYPTQNYQPQSGYPAPGGTLGQSSGGQSWEGQSGQSAGYQGSRESSGDYDEYGKRYGNGHHRNPVAKAADAVKDTLSDVGSEIKDRVEGAGQEIKERVDDMRHNVQDRMGNMRHDMQDRMGNRMEEMRYQQWQMEHQMQRSLHNAEDRMHEMRRRARHEGKRRGQQMMRNLEDNPLTYGALALAAGAALAMLLPQTRAENRYFGEMRDEIMERGQEVFENTKRHAQQVVEEVRPELEDKVRQIADDVKETGKQAVKEAADELRPVVDKAMEKGKQEARTVAQEAGVDPDKLMGKGTLNRDTMAGQWKQLRGDVKSKWGQLTDDELTQIGGDYEKLVGAIQTRYGYTRGQIEREINDFFNSRNQKNMGQSGSGQSGSGQSAMGQSSGTQSATAQGGNPSSNKPSGSKA